MHPLHPPDNSRWASEWAGDLQSKIRDFGYSSQGDHNSMSLLQATDICEKGRRLSSLTSSSSSTKPSSALRNESECKYKELVRRLPPQPCIDILNQTFFSDINWQYDLIDETIFQKQLRSWGGVSYSDLQAGFDRLAPGTLVFPALLFQVLAQALLFHSPHDHRISSLITMAGMTFIDLAAEYSSTGAEILAILGKRDITIATVQAGLLQASFLKSSGKVVEAWHALGATIRDAQEIGLHTGRFLPEQRNLIEHETEEQTLNVVSHKVWVVLHIWDVHMAVVLGRPIATTLHIEEFSRTIEDEEKRQDLFLHWQSEVEPPRPFDVILAGYNVAYKYFQDVHRLERNGDKPQEYSTVEHIHAAVKQKLNLLPSWCRLENTDTKFDNVYGCQWLPVAREGLSSLIHLVLLTLHRPYIFSVANSRTAAINAGISILHAQERLFQYLAPHQCKVFNPVYASFDAIVLIAAIYLAFPNTDPERRPVCVQVVAKGVERLGVIGQYNVMAKSAHDIVRGLYVHLKQRLSVPETPICTCNTTPSINQEQVLLDSHANVSQELPLDLSFDAVLPPRPTHDLFDGHIPNTRIPFMDTPDDLTLSSPTIYPTGNWNFEECFSDSSFWDLMNEFNY